MYRKIRRQRTKRPAIERFNEKYVVCPSGCWIWTASVDDCGYGNFAAEPPRSMRAHKWIYQHMVGMVPEGLELDHLCRVRNCVNWRHLEAVTHRENMIRADFKNNRRKRVPAVTCPNGHAYTGARSYDNKSQRCRVCANAARKRWEDKNRERRRAHWLNFYYRKQAKLAAYVEE
jgi:hypothetical protein